MKFAEIAGLSEKELKNKTLELRKQLFEARMKNALGQLANPMAIREARRNIARLQTALRTKAKGASKG
jgi:large subunit ribosomal protein L29